MAKQVTLGRPSNYDPGTVEKILYELSTTTDGFEVICERNGLPPSTGWYWLNTHGDFLEKYLRARELQSELGYDEMREIADAPLPEADIYDELGKHLGSKIDAGAAMAEIQKRKLQIDVIKFKMVKLQPKRFGESKTLEVNHRVIRPVSEDQFQAIRAEMQQALLASSAEDAEYEEE